MVRRLAIAGLAVVLALGCSADEPPETDEGPRVYLSVVSGIDNPTRLTVVDVTEGRRQRSRQLLEAESTGFVHHLSGGQSPSGRFGVYVLVREIDPNEPADYLPEYYLLDFERAPLGPLRRLSIPAFPLTVGWNPDESLAYLINRSYGQPSLWTVAIGDDPPRPAMRIPIEVPYPALVGVPRFSPESTWLTFTAGQDVDDRLFAVRLDDRTPVELVEIRESVPAHFVRVLWIDDHGRGIASAWDQRYTSSYLVGFDLSVGPEAVALEGSSSVELSSAWTHAWWAGDPGGEPLRWVLHQAGIGDERELSWLALAWTDAGPVVDDVVVVGAELLGNENVVTLHADQFYFPGEIEHAPPELPERGLLRVALGASEAELVWPAPSGYDITGFASNRAQTLLAVRSNYGVVVFEPTGETTGAAILASPVDFGAWGLWGERFVHPDGGWIGGVVRVIDFADTPASVVDLDAEFPIAALPSPIDDRTFVLDDGRIYLDDPAEPGMRELLVLPDPDASATETGTDESDDGVTEDESSSDTGPGPVEIDPDPYRVQQASVHAPGVASYAPGF